MKPSVLAQNMNSPRVVDDDDLDATIPADEPDEQTLDGGLGGEITSLDDLYGVGSTTLPDNAVTLTCAAVWDRL